MQEQALVLYMECPLPDFYGNYDAFLVTAGVIYVLDFIHCIIIIPARDYSFPGAYIVCKSGP